LLDISVGDRCIDFSAGTFDLKPSTGNGGWIIDTEAMATFIDRGPYERVMTEFDEHFTSFCLERVHKEVGLEYWYKYNPKFRPFLPMTFHF
jgi:hypothetical protein